MLDIDYFDLVNGLNNIMRNTFTFSLIILFIVLISFQIIWLIGIKIKSERLIKSGVIISFSTLFLLLFLILIIIVISKIK